jgi:hypothetical protein
MSAAAATLGSAAQPQPSPWLGPHVQLALAVAETALTETADVAILFTHDTGPRRIETAGWASGSYVQRLRQVRGVHHHAISRKVFDLVETPVNYAHDSRK